MIRAAEKDSENPNLGMLFLYFKVEHEVFVGDIADSAFQFRVYRSPVRMSGKRLHVLEGPTEPHDGPLDRNSVRACLYSTEQTGRPSRCKAAAENARKRHGKTLQSGS
jgi:hypothetical protein